MEEKLFRQFTMDRVRANEKEKIVPASLSSTEPYERYFGYEVLSHSSEAIDLTRAADGLPLLFDHERGAIIGVAENVRIEGDRLHADLRFGNSAQAKEIWADVLAGIIRNMSIGYIVHENEESGELDGVPVVTAKRWELLEASVVSIPADSSVGINRSQQQSKYKGVKVMEKKKTRSENKRIQREKLDLSLDREAEAERQEEIRSVAAMLGADHPQLLDESVEAIRAGTSTADFNLRCLDFLSNAEPLDLSPARSMQGFDNSDYKGFSIIKAVRAMVDPKALRDAGFEMEVSRDLAKKMGRDTRGFFMPTGSPSERSLTAGGTGNNVIATDLQHASFIDILRNKSVLMNKPITLLNGLVGDVDIPLKSASSTGYWIAGDDADSITSSEPTLGKISLSPKTVGGLVTISHKMLTQSSLVLDSIITNDIAETIGIEIDAKAIAGDGTGNTPLGILNTTGVLTQTILAPGSPTFAELVGFETSLLNANVDTAMSYVMTPSVAGNLKTTEKAAGTAQFLWENGVVNGMPAQATKNVPANTILLGSWNNFIMGTWGVVEIEADGGGANFAKGSVSLRVIMDVDFGLRHTGAFCRNA
ncbi:MAG: phage major capsid protein [Gammaproteobacteria bacterium]|nr:phage major capsid protein [Gammaproteobacteria bacterium]